MIKKFILTLAVFLFATGVTAFAAQQKADYGKYLNTKNKEKYSMTVLNKVNSPEDVKKLSVKDMDLLANDIREGILNRVNTIGGHLGPDLGIVEATIALHYVFDSPKDKIVYDVSHQVYPHKMLTGRKHGFIDDSRLQEITGYSNPKESVHDHFVIGHTSTSVSLATGMAKARDVKGEKYNVIALIGDGSLSGGEAYEGFNNAAMLDSNIIIIVNDNEMSIAPNEGGLYKNLAELRQTKGQAQNNVFKAIGFEYYYLEEGNNTEKLIEIFKKVKDTNKPTVVHIHTLKGKGYTPAETDKETYHWTLPGFLDKKSAAAEVETYNSITKDYLLAKKQAKEPVVAITAATPGVFGFTPDFREKMGENYTDVGIAEEHAIAYASGLATNGAKPVLALMSSFVQRTYDQMSQDLALNNSPATILIYWGGISNADMTHLCTFDISLISNIPNIVYLAPTNKEEYLAMLDWSYNQKEHPVFIRVPAGDIVSTGEKDTTDYSQLNKYKLVEKGQKVAIIAAGNFFALGKQVKEELKKQLGIDATLINPRYLTGVDKELLEELKKDHSVVITLEDGEINGGFGEKVTRYYGNSSMKVLNFGSKKEFTDRVPLEELYQRYHLTKELIVEDIKNILD